MQNDWNGQKVVIIGAARQGLALARYLLSAGAQVWLTDQRPLDALGEARTALVDLEAVGLPLAWVCGGHPFSLLDGAGWVCPSGGVPLDLPLIAEAQRRGIRLTNDSQIFLEVAPCPVIGITGSAGKTTTTTLVGRMAAAAVQLPGSALRRTWVGGNIGAPLIADLDRMAPDHLAVMELSSFQLEIMTRSPHTAAVLNITPNHLDRHGTMQAYAAAKAHILLHQTVQDTAVLGRDDPGAWALAGQVAGRLLSFGFSPLPPGQAGGYVDGDSLYLRRAPGEPGERLLDRSQILLRGRHNVLNVLAACTIAAAAGLPVEALRQGVQGFTGVAHRLEFVRQWRGASWYNDSIATAPERAMAALHSFDEPLVLLVGGRDKKLPWEDFADLALRRVDHLVAFGEAAGLIAAAMQAAKTRAGGAPGRLRSVHQVGGLKEAVQAAAGLVEPGSVVLLSPGGTSYDEFKDFEERGRCFANWVNELA